MDTPINRCTAGDVFAASWTIILYGDWPGDLALEGIEDRRTHGAFIDRAERVEIPIVAVPEAARLVTEARRLLRRHSWRLIERGMVDTRPRSQQIRNGGAFSSAVRDGSLSSMPSAPTARERSISPRSTAMPIRALSRFLSTCGAISKDNWGC